MYSLTGYVSGVEPGGFACFVAEPAHLGESDWYRLYWSDWFVSLVSSLYVVVTFQPGLRTSCVGLEFVKQLLAHPLVPL